MQPGSTRELGAHELASRIAPGRYRTCAAPLNNCIFERSLFRNFLIGYKRFCASSLCIEVTGGRGLAVFGEALDTPGLCGQIKAIASGAFHVCILYENGTPGREPLRAEPCDVLES